MAKVKYIRKILREAEKHGDATEGFEMHIGDLEVLLGVIWELLTPEQVRAAIQRQPLLDLAEIPEHATLRRLRKLSDAELA